ncbi:MAG: hypothetical protein ABT20_02115 [Rubrivivax sp. SCN 70-15]|nr:MAG: hypothetical protein ABT20_02115 [Rubrivivax sp. SCN 70-15]
MMPTRRERAAQLAARRLVLVAKAQREREAVADRWQRIGPSLVWIDRGWRVWLVVRAHPWAALAPLAAVLALRPRWAWRGAAAVAALARARRLLR